MGRKLVIEGGDGQVGSVLEQVAADNEYQLQEKLKRYPELLPLDELGVPGKAVVVGRESALDSGNVDLVLLGSAGDLALVEFKTGPQNPDFRACLAQLLDYGSDLWGMSLDDFEARVFRPYVAKQGNSSGVPPDASLDDLMAGPGTTDEQDAVDWRQRLQTQLRDGSFHYVVVAQRFTDPVLRTLRYLNATVRGARFSAVELIRFSGAEHSAFEARFVAGAQPVSGGGSAKTALSGLDEFLAGITEDDYRHALQDLFSGLSEISGFTVYWGTTGCSLRVVAPNHGPLSIGWVFPPGPPRWMGLTDVTLGWYEDANGLAVNDQVRADLQAYRSRLQEIPGGRPPSSAAIHGVTFPPAATIEHVTDLSESIREVVLAIAQVPG